MEFGNTDRAVAGFIQGHRCEGIVERGNDLTNTQIHPDISEGMVEFDLDGATVQRPLRTIGIYFCTLIDVCTCNAMVM